MAGSGRVTRRRTPVFKTTLPARLRRLALEHGLDLAALLREAVVRALVARGVDVGPEDVEPPRQGRPPRSR